MKNIQYITPLVLGVTLLIVGTQFFQTTSATPTTVAAPPPGLTNFELGQYYFNQDQDTSGPYDLERARTYYRAALAENPRGHLEAWYQLGRVDFAEYRFSAALHKFSKQIEYFGDTLPNVYYMIGLTYGYKALESTDPEDWRQAEAGFETFIAYAPTEAWPRVDLAWVYFSQGKYEEMIPVLEAGLVHQPEQPWLLNTYGVALLNAGRTQEARTQFLQAQAAAEQLTVNDWAAAYSGNSPAEWGQGLEEFRATIAANLALTE